MPQLVYPGIGFHEPAVGRAAEPVHIIAAPNSPVDTVAMDDKKPLTAGALVAHFKRNLYSTDISTGQCPEFDIVVSGNINYASAGSGEFEETRHNLPVRRRESRSGLQSLQIDNVSGEVNDSGGDLLKKRQKVACSGRARPQVNVGQPERSIRLSHFLSLGRQHLSKILNNLEPLFDSNLNLR
jgi:hypothetical protein